MDPSHTLGDRLRDQLFVLAWIVLAVVAKYSLSATSGPPAIQQNHQLNAAIATAR